MDIVEVIEIALANSSSRRVEVAALERAAVATEAVSGVTQIVSELVDNAVAFSEPGDRVRVTGLFDQNDYLISISDRGVGIPEELLAELNRALDDPKTVVEAQPLKGIAMMARLAGRNGIGVQLVPGVPGTTARVTIPSALVEPGSAEPGGSRLPARESFTALAEEFEEADAAPEGDMVDRDRWKSTRRPASGVVAMSEESRREAEVFLERVFGPLVESPPVTRRETTTSPTNGNSHLPEPEQEPEVEGATITALRTRVPGENFSLIEDDPSTAAAERAIDIRSSLSKYQQGRRAAEDAE